MKRYSLRFEVSNQKKERGEGEGEGEREEGERGERRGEQKRKTDQLANNAEDTHPSLKD